MVELNANVLVLVSIMVIRYLITMVSIVWSRKLDVTD